MRPSFLLLLFCVPYPKAFAIDLIEDVKPNTFSKTSKAETIDYHGYGIGDHYEWTTYQRDYSRISYGHIFDWSAPGLGKVSVCLELDSETRGGRYRNFVDEAHCRKPETAYRWYIPFEGENSRCVEEDKGTQGLRFARIVAENFCAKPETEYLWKKRLASSQPTCAEVDARTQGQLYRSDAKPYLCGHALNVELAYGRKLPAPPSRAPASVKPAVPYSPEVDKTYWEDPEDLVDHVHRGGDKIHRR